MQSKQNFPFPNLTICSAHVDMDLGYLEQIYMCCNCVKSVSKFIIQSQQTRHAEYGKICTLSSNFNRFFCSDLIFQHSLHQQPQQIHHGYNVLNLLMFEIGSYRVSNQIKQLKVSILPVQFSAWFLVFLGGKNGVTCR